MSSKKDTKGRKLLKNENQMSDGRYRYRFIDKDGERRAIYSWKLTPTDKTPQGKKEDLSLREKEKEIEKDLDDGIIVNDDVIVSDMILKYIYTKPMLANSTKTNYIHFLEKNIKPNRLGRMKVKDVRKSDVKAFYSYLYSDKKFKISTIQVYQNLMFPAFQLAVDDNLIRLNPCRACMRDFTHGMDESTVKFPLSKEQQNAFLSFTKQDPTYSRYYVMFAFMLSTGCRISETLGITWNDIDLQKQVVSVNHQVIYKKKDGKCIHYVEPPKNRTSREIPLRGIILDILKKYRSDNYFVSKTGFSIDGLNTFVFLNCSNKLYTPNTIQRVCREIRDKYNAWKEEDEIELPNFSPHTLRHTFCTRMAENGMDVKVLQTIMGHKSISVTMEVYNHVDVDRSQREADKITPVLEA